MARSFLTEKCNQHCSVSVIVELSFIFLSWIDNVKPIRSERQMTENLVGYMFACPLNLLGHVIVHQGELPASLATAS